MPLKVATSRGCRLRAERQQCIEAAFAAGAEAAAKAGAHGLMVLPGVPYKSEAHETMAHFRAVAKAGGLPVMIYNNPVAYGVNLTPEMIAAVSKIMRNQDLIIVARKCEVITQFRNTLGIKGRFSTRLQPNHPTDDPKAIAASIIDGLLIFVINQI